jgi:hypothetical protein
VYVLVLVVLKMLTFILVEKYDYTPQEFHKNVPENMRKTRANA